MREKFTKQNLDTDERPFNHDLNELSKDFDTQNGFPAKKESEEEKDVSKQAKKHQGDDLGFA